MNDIKEILEEREKNYGSFEKFANIMSDFQSTMAANRAQSWKPYQRESMHMIFHKITRIINGDPEYIDSWQDIAGYAQLVVDILEEKSLKEESK